MRRKQIYFVHILIVLMLSAAGGVWAQIDPLPSWNDTPAKRAIKHFVGVTTNAANPQFIPVEDRFATFDQDGTLWVSHPIYTQLVFAFDRLVELAPQHPEWKTTEPFKSVISNNKSAIEKLTTEDLEKIVLATHSGISVEAFQKAVKEWITKAKDSRWNRPYTDLVYQPMLELMQYLRCNGYKTYIVTGGGQDFVRTYSEHVYGVPPEQVIGSALETKFLFNKDQKAVLMRSPKLLLNNNMSGKPEDIHLFIGQRPRAAFGNSTGDASMLEYTQSGSGARLMVLVLHDDAQREYAYGPTNGLPDTKIGTFTQDLMDEAKSSGWVVISMKNDWKRVFLFER